MAESLYIHIPFCGRKCIYCDFLSVPYNSSLAHDYVGALCTELHLKKNESGILKTIYIGGGTPSILGVEDLQKLLSSVHGNYKLSDDVEFTIEANPGSVTPDLLRLLKSFGVNRISLGVQSFRDEELNTLGRIHSSREAGDAVELCFKAGFDDVSVDLMYGIPGQTMDNWNISVTTAVQLHVKHISAYELTPEHNTELYRLIGRGALRMPNEGLVVEMYSAAIDNFEKSGLIHYEVSNFAQNGYVCRHNMNYWKRGKYIGAGAGAHSFLSNVRSHNTKDIIYYIQMLRNSKVPKVSTMLITPLEAARELIFLGLRTREGISHEDAAQAGLDLESLCSDLIRDGYLKEQAGRISHTRKGMLLSNQVIVNIFRNAGI